jgi:hypothetical protein
MVMTMRNPWALEQLQKAIASLLTAEGTAAEQLIDAYEGVSTALRQPGVLTGALRHRAERLEADLDQYASRQGMSTILAIAHMEEPMLRYWSIRMLGLADLTGRPGGAESNAQP